MSADARFRKGLPKINKGATEKEDQQLWISSRLNSGVPIEQLLKTYKAIAPTKPISSRFDDWADQEKSDVHFQNNQFDVELAGSEDDIMHKALEGNKHWDESPEDLYIDQIDRGVEVDPQYKTKINNRTGRFNGEDE